MQVQQITPKMDSASDGATTDISSVLWIMAFTAGAGISNVFYVQSMVDVIGTSLAMSPADLGLVPASTIGGYALGLFFLVPLGDRFDRKRLILLQLVRGGRVFAGHGDRTKRDDTVARWARGRDKRILYPADPSLRVEPGVACDPRASGRHGRQCDHAGHPSRANRIGRHLGIFRLADGVFRRRSPDGPRWILVYWRLPSSRRTTDLPYSKLMGSLWPLVRDHAVLREAMLLQVLIFGAFNAFWATLPTLLEGEPYHLGSGVAGAFGIIGAVGAMAAAMAGRLSDKLGPRRVAALSAITVLVSFGVLLSGPMVDRSLDHRCGDDGCRRPRFARLQSDALFRT